MQLIVQKFNRNLYSQLNSIKHEVEQNNMETINNCQEAIDHALNDMSNPQTVVFSIKFIKDLVETLNFTFIHWVEINVLPHMEQIGRFQHHSQNMDRGKYFFNGNPTKEQSQYGQTLLILVLESLQAWARWFPKFNGKETQFIRVYDLLKDLQVAFPPPTYFKVEHIEKIAQKIQDLQPKIQQRPSVIKLTLSEKGEQQLMKYQQLKLDIIQALTEKNIQKLQEINQQYEQLQAQCLAQNLIEELLHSDVPNHIDLAEQLLDYEDRGSEFNTEFKKQYLSDDSKLQNFILIYLQTKQEILTPNPDQQQLLKQEISQDDAKIYQDDVQNNQFNVPQKQQQSQSNYYQQSHISSQQLQQQQQQQQQKDSSQHQDNQVIDELKKKEVAYLLKISELHHRIGVQELDIQASQQQLIDTKKHFDQQLYDIKNQQRDNQVHDNQQEQKDELIQQQQVEIQRLKRIVEELNYQMNQVKESHDHLSNQHNQMQGQANKLNEVLRDHNSLQQNYQEQNELFQIKELQLQDQLQKAQMLISLKDENISELTYVVQQQRFQLEQDVKNRNEIDDLNSKFRENDQKLQNMELDCQKLKQYKDNMNEIIQKLKEDNISLGNKNQEIMEANLKYQRSNEEKSKTIQFLESQQSILSDEIHNLQELLSNNKQHIDIAKFQLFEHKFSLFDKVVKIERSEGKNMQRPTNHKDARKVDPIAADLIYPVNPADYYKFREKKLSQYKGKQVALSYTLEKQSDIYKDSCLLDESIIFSGNIVNVYFINKMQVNMLSFLLFFKLKSKKTYKIRSLDFQGCEYNIIGQVPQLLDQDFMFEINLKIGQYPLICSLILDDLDQNHVIRFQLPNIISKGINVDNNFDSHLLRHYWRTMKTIFKGSLFSVRLDGSDILQKFPQFMLMNRQSKINDYQVGIGDRKIGFLFRMENRYYLLRLVLKPNNQGLIQIGSENGSMELSSKIITDYQQALN